MSTQTMAHRCMTKAERLELGKVVRMRAKLTKDDLAQHGARLLADAEAKLAARYPDNHEAWAEFTERVKRAVAEADAEIAVRCRELGIPENFRPSITWWWRGRGENGLRERRAELSKLVRAEIAARVKAGKVEIDRWASEKLTHLVAGSLESREAREFLESLPSAANLLPGINQLKLGEDDA